MCVCRNRKIQPEKKISEKKYIMTPEKKWNEINKFHFHRKKRIAFFFSFGCRCCRCYCWSTVGKKIYFKIQTQINQQTHKHTHTQREYSLWRFYFTVFFLKFVIPLSLSLSIHSNSEFSIEFLEFSKFKCNYFHHYHCFFWVHFILILV